MNFFETLIHPDREELENAERVHVCRAANVLQVGEFQLLQLAYKEWFGEDLPEALVARLFSSYMLDSEVPHWARHYARVILIRAEHNRLDDNDPRYHRYDHDYVTHVPRGVQRFCYAAGILAFLMVTSVLIASMTQREWHAGDADPRSGVERAAPIAEATATARGGVCFPPCVRDSELRPDLGRDRPWGRGTSPNGAGHP